jgi:PAS domain S-box-containing protein
MPQGRDSSAAMEAFSAGAGAGAAPSGGTPAHVFDAVTRREVEDENTFRYRQLFEALPVAMYATDAEGKVTVYNQAAVTLWGRAPVVGSEQWCGSLRMFWPDGAPLPLDQCPMAIAIREGRSLEAMEAVVERPSGELRNVLAHPRVLRDSSGAVTGGVNILVDITERRQNERRIRESEARFRGMADHAPVMIRLTDAECHTTYLNRCWYEFTGLAPQSALGRGWLDAIHPEDRQTALEAFQDAMAHARPFQLEYRLRHASGDWRWVIATAGPRSDEGGDFLGYIVSTIDISERRRMEDELRRVNTELEEFGYVASHDLQEPLRTVNIFVQKLLEEYENADGPARQYSTFIRQGVERMEQLIRDLLSYSRTSRQDLHPPQRFPLGVALDVATDILRERIQATGAQLVRGELPTVMGDVTQLAQVFQNLLSNAMKYAKNDVPARIEISSQRRGPEHIISIKDNGIGFDQKHAERVFGLFKRLHRDEYPGTGLGLAICKRIVERSGGRIWARSEPRVGSVFSFSLPAVLE